MSKRYFINFYEVVNHKRNKIKKVLDRISVITWGKLLQVNRDKSVIEGSVLKLTFGIVYMYRTPSFKV